jgi:predicted metal-dependent hydrolase
MRQKWGSCSTRGRVTLNSELLTAPAALRNEVIVEELLHLKVPNHGKLFKTLKRAYLLTRQGHGAEP